MKKIEFTQDKNPQADTIRIYGVFYLANKEDYLKQKGT